MAKFNLKSIFTSEDKYTVIQLLKAFVDYIDSLEYVSPSDMNKNYIAIYDDTSDIKVGDLPLKYGRIFFDIGENAFIVYSTRKIVGQPIRFYISKFTLGTTEELHAITSDVDKTLGELEFTPVE